MHTRPPSLRRAGPRLHRPSPAGFSLIELSVVLVLLTIILGLGLGALNARFQSANTSVTRQRMDLVREALLAHLGATHRLPCAEDVSAGGVTGLEECPNTFGTIPFVTLGLARETSEDGWGNLMSYGVFANTAPTCPGSGIDWKSATCFGEGKVGGITLNDGTVAAPIPLTTQAIAVIISHGPNGLGAWTRQGSRNAAPVSCEEAQNTQQAIPSCTLAAQVFFRGERTDVDDLASTLLAGEAIQRLARDGVLQSPTARLGADLQAAVDQFVGAFAAAGCTLTPSAPSGLDPWGHAYSTTISLSGATVFQITSSGCTTCTPPVAATTRSVTKTELNAYLLKAGLEPCP
ncbi:MAG: prepilin-type N-terminal cleavage/methylation domain-containing protein [Zoogloeaceae bacterium]|nr:prepilin-type N-terminal cleavage/methylation domain-containing protein [Zoogloeaceae bacterium]